MSNLGTVFIKQKKIDQAEKVLEKSIKINSIHENTLYNLSCVLALKNKNNECVTLLNKLVKLEPSWLLIIEKDEDFNGIRNDKRFKKLILQKSKLPKLKI